jgi:hypothetical protein
VVQRRNGTQPPAPAPRAAATATAAAVSPDARREPDAGRPT